MNTGNRNQSDLFLTDFKVGDKIELHPSTDFWMAGDRYGEVIKIGRVYLHVKMLHSEKIRRIVPEHVGGKLANWEVKLLYYKYEAEETREMKEETTFPYPTKLTKTTPIEQEMNKNLMIHFINRHGRYDLDVRKSYVYYDKSKSFVLALNTKLEGVSADLIFEKLNIKYWSKGIV